MKKPLFIILNGGEAVGKGTQKEKLLGLYPEAVQIREPGGTPEAEVIRDVILNIEDTIERRIEKLNEIITANLLIPLTKTYLEEAISEMKTNGLTGKAETYLYAASRAESNAKIVAPALKNQQIVLGDRSVACSMAYQGYAREMGMDFVWDVNKVTLQDAYPHVEIFLHLPLEVASERLKNRTEKQDRLDLEKEEFHQKVREGYLEYYNHYCPYPYEIIDASGTIEEVHEKIKKVIAKYAN